MTHDDQVIQLSQLAERLLLAQSQQSDLTRGFLQQVSDQVGQLQASVDAMHGTALEIKLHIENQSVALAQNTRTIGGFAQTLMAGLDSFKQHLARREKATPALREGERERPPSGAN